MEYLSVWSLAKKVSDNQDAIKAHLGVSPAGKKPVLKSGGAAAAGIITLIILCLVYLGLYIWAIVALFKFWKLLPVPVAILSLGLLIFGTPFFSLIVTYAAKA